MSLPGSRLRAFAVSICRSSTVERLVDPIISDLRIECAAVSGSSWRRRGVLLRAYVSFWKALVVHTALSIGRRGEAGDRALFRRAIGFACLGFAVVTVLLALPPLVDGIRLDGGKVQQLTLALTLIPQALPISIPIGVCIGIMSAIRARTPTRHDLLVTLTIGLSAACLVWAVIEWGVPLGNQKFRELVTAALTDGRIVHLEPGLNELGFSGLARRTDVAAIRHYHLLWALSFAAIPLAVFTLAVAARVRRAAPRALLILVTVAGYYAVLWVSDSSLRHGAPVLVAWMPNAVFLGLGLIGLLRQTKRGSLPLNRSSGIGV
jgi:lipopolysaccharide export LptBFGC system permease protein LptF